MADAMDSKSIVRKDVWVRLPPPVSSSLAVLARDFFCSINIPVTVQIVKGLFLCPLLISF